MSDIVIGVVADMRRQQQAWDLAKALDATVVSFDDGTLGCTRNHLKVWTKLLQHGGNWAVVIEDDALLCDDFDTTLAAVLAKPPADIVGLYLGKNYPRAWQRVIKPKMATDAHWITSTHLLHGLGTCMRMSLLEDMLRFVGRMEDGWPIDEKITHWCRLRGHRVAYTKPSIIEHADGPSLLVHPDGDKRELPRRAWEFGRRDEWDWESAVEIP